MTWQSITLGPHLLAPTHKHTPFLPLTNLALGMRYRGNAPETMWPIQQTPLRRCHECNSWTYVRKGRCINRNCGLHLSLYGERHGALQHAVDEAQPAASAQMDTVQRHAANRYCENGGGEPPAELVLQTAVVIHSFDGADWSLRHPHNGDNFLTVNINDTVQCIKQENSWIMVDAQGTRGWVPLSYIRIRDLAETNTEVFELNAGYFCIPTTFARPCGKDVFQFLSWWRHAFPSIAWSEEHEFQLKQTALVIQHVAKRDRVLDIHVFPRTHSGLRLHLYQIDCMPLNAHDSRASYHGQLSAVTGVNWELQAVVLSNACFPEIMRNAILQIEASDATEIGAFCEHAKHRSVALCYLLACAAYPNSRIHCRHTRAHQEGRQRFTTWSLRHQEAQPAYGETPVC